MPFTDELMTCVVCGRQERSQPRVSSDWRNLQVDACSFYVCPDEFPDANPSQQEYKKAYQIAIACCINEMLKATGKEPLKEIEEYRIAMVKFRASQTRSKGHGFQSRRAEN